MTETKVSKTAKIIFIIFLIFFIFKEQSSNELNLLKDLIFNNILLVIIITILFVIWRTKK